ncbi:MAG TPA: arylamine N-acetyltransferase [Opitutaceae bacterium]
MAQQDRPDIEAYLRRIGHSAGTAPTLETLDGILARHICSIPFENVSVLLGDPVALDLASVERKLVRGRRGGYCFEQNGYLLAVLAAMGYRARPLSARVRFQQPRQFVPPRTHLFLEVEIGGERWMADVGVGGLSPGKALRMSDGGAQSTPWEERRLVAEGGRWYHQVRFAGEWNDLTDYTGEEMPAVDREVANWWTSMSPASKFRKDLSVAIAAPGGTRITLQNREFTVRKRGEVAERRQLASHGELVAVLAESFGIDVPRGAQIRAPGLDWST